MIPSDTTDWSIELEFDQDIQAWDADAKEVGMIMKSDKIATFTPKSKQLNPGKTVMIISNCATPMPIISKYEPHNFMMHRRHILTFSRSRHGSSAIHNRVRTRVSLRRVVSVVMRKSKAVHS